MGMFDYVIPECVLPDAIAAEVDEWQTKTFDAPFMERYKISPDGRLLRERYRIEDRSDKTAAPGTLASVIGMWTKVPEGWADINFEGTLNFYGSPDPYWQGEWVEYDATFVGGSLASIKRIPDPPSDG